MTKPRLVKVRALFYVLQHITKRGYAYFDTASFLLGCEVIELRAAGLWRFSVDGVEGVEIDLGEGRLKGVVVH